MLLKSFISVYFSVFYHAQKLKVSSKIWRIFYGKKLIDVCRRLFAKLHASGDGARTFREF